MFTEIHKLLTIYLTVPMISATAEIFFYIKSERLYMNNNEPAALESCNDIAHLQAAN